MVKRAVGVLVLLSLAGCEAGPSAAERATYQAVAPDHRRYVERDFTLTDEQRQTRFDLLESWRLRVGAPKR